MPHDTHFSDRLADAIDRVGSPACIGLDPVIEKLPGSLRPASDGLDAIREFCLGVIDAAAGAVPAVKPQSACFERYGAEGAAILEDLCAHAAERGLIVVLDAKRGDIGITAEHYAAAASALGGHAITVNAYLGPETVRPYLDAGLGVFVLVRTSNRDSDAVQSHPLADGRTVAEMRADHVAGLGSPRRGRRGLSDVGAVVAATKPAEGGALRARMPDSTFLVPGYGAQGGTAADIRPMARPGARSPGEAGVLVTASRSVIYAFEPSDRDWQAAVARAAKMFADEIRSVVA